MKKPDKRFTVVPTDVDMARRMLKLRSSKIAARQISQLIEQCEKGLDKPHAEIEAQLIPQVPR